MRSTVFNITLIFNLVFEDMCQWVKIYEQTGPSRFALDKCTLDSCNEKVDDSNFITFDLIRDFSQFRFKFEWDDKEAMTWKQDKNPLSEIRTVIYDISFKTRKLKSSV